MTTEELLQEAIGHIDEARPMPLSGSVMVSRDTLLALLDAAQDALPDELRQARWLLREREDVLGRARADGISLIEEARIRVAQMVQRTEVVRTAERRARQLIDDAESQARRRKHQIDDYCERRLDRFDHDLTQILERVQVARAKLEPPPVPYPATDPRMADSGRHGLGVGDHGGTHGLGDHGLGNHDLAYAGESQPTRPLLFDQEKI